MDRDLSDHETSSPTVIVLRDQSDTEESAPEIGDESESETTLTKSGRKNNHKYVPTQVAERSDREGSDLSSTESSTLTLTPGSIRRAANEASLIHTMARKKRDKDKNHEIVPAEPGDKKPEGNGGETPAASPSKNKMTTVTAKEHITIVLAGKSGAGKSTLAKKLFNIKRETKMSANSVTKALDTHSDTKHGVTINIIDTIGFNMKEKKQQLKELSKYSNGESDLVIYCLPIGPGSRFNDSNPDIMRSLTEAFGKDIWRHCMVVLTFSNLAWDRISMDHEDDEDQDAAIAEYKAYIAEYIQRFEQELTNLEVEGVDVKSVFDIDSASNSDDIKWTIVFIPAGYRPSDQVLPGLDYRVKTNIAPAADRRDSASSESSDSTADDQEARVRSKPITIPSDQTHEDKMQPRPHEDQTMPLPHKDQIRPRPHRARDELQEIEVNTHQWTDILVLEMIKRSNLECNLALLLFWYSRRRIARAFKGHGINLKARVSHSIGGGMSGGVVGGFVGGGTGFVLGGVGGPVGMGIGLTLGVLTGIIAGTLVGGGGGAALSHSLAIAKEEEEKQQKKANKREEQD